jgi:hypothetical protein
MFFIVLMSLIHLDLYARLLIQEGFSVGLFMKNIAFLVGCGVVETNNVVSILGKNVDFTIENKTGIHPHRGQWKMCKLRKQGL